MSVSIYQFPYKKIKQGERVIIYGGGNVGKSFVEQINKNSYCNILAIADKNFKNIVSISGIRVISPDEISKYDYDKIIIAVQKHKNEIFEFLYGGG